MRYLLAAATALLCLCVAAGCGDDGARVANEGEDAAYTEDDVRAALDLRTVSDEVAEFQVTPSGCIVEQILVGKSEVKLFEEGGEEGLVIDGSGSVAIDPGVGFAGGEPSSLEGVELKAGTEPECADEFKKALDDLE